MKKKPKNLSSPPQADGSSLKDGVRSPVLWEELRVEPPFMWLGNLFWAPPSRTRPKGRPKNTLLEEIIRCVHAKKNKNSLNFGLKPKYWQCHSCTDALSILNFRRTCVWWTVCPNSTSEPCSVHTGSWEINH